jgi:hypothetical protein
MVGFQQHGSQVRTHFAAADDEDVHIDLRDCLRDCLLTGITRITR